MKRFCLLAAPVMLLGMVGASFGAGTGAEVGDIPARPVAKFTRPPTA